MDGLSQRDVLCTAHEPREHRRQRKFPNNPAILRTDYSTGSLDRKKMLPFGNDLIIGAK